MEQPIASQPLNVSSADSRMNERRSNGLRIYFLFVLTVLLMAATSVAGFTLGQRSVRGSGDTPSEEVRSTPTPESKGNVACTMEAKLCPDGSSVGRSGPNCEFAPCPGEETSRSMINFGEWSTYKSEHYPYQLQYPNYGFTYTKRDRGNDTYAGYVEQAYFEKSPPWGLTVDAFSVLVSKNKESIEYIFDGNPTGSVTIDGLEAKYREMPEGYLDGGSLPPAAPMVVIQFQKDEAIYKVIFTGTSSIQDSLVQEVIKRFEFTD